MADRLREQNRREDLRAGVVASVIANVNRGKGDRTWKPEDFIPH